MWVDLGALRSRHEESAWALSRIEEQQSFKVTTVNEIRRQLFSYQSHKMLQFGKEQKEKETCFVTHGTMGHLDPTQPPTKRKPYSAILSMPAVSKVCFQE